MSGRPNTAATTLFERWLRDTNRDVPKWQSWPNVGRGISVKTREDWERFRDPGCAHSETR